MRRVFLSGLAGFAGFAVHCNASAPAGAARTAGAQAGGNMAVLGEIIGASAVPPSGAAARRGADVNSRNSHSQLLWISLCITPGKTLETLAWQGFQQDAQK